MKKILIGMIVIVLLCSVAFSSTQQKGSDSIQTKNQGEDNQMQVQAQNIIRSTNYSTANGDTLRIQTRSNNQTQLTLKNYSAQTNMEMIQEKTQTGTRLQVQLRNGQNAQIKIMPDVASNRALERLQLRVCSDDNNCSLELKEVGNRAVYEMRAQKEARLFGLFKTKMQVQAQVDAENGTIIQSQKPWWAFLASESEQ